MDTTGFISNSGPLVNFLSNTEKKYSQVSEEKKRDSQDIIELISTSELTHCPRKIVYKLRNESGDFSKSLSNNTKNSASIEKWKRIFKNLKEDSEKFNFISYPETKIYSVSLGLFGHVSFILNHNYKKFCVNVIEVDEEIFSPKRSHVVDLMTCIFLLGVQRGVIIYEPSIEGTFSRTSFEIGLNQGVLNGVKQVCLSMNKYKHNKNLPKRPYDDKENPECMNCPYRETCWK